MKPLCFDLYCGLGGWTEGFLAEGYEVFGFDIERHEYGSGGYPGQLVLQDVCMIHGAQLRDAAVIVASPPCQEFSYRAMPWKRAKALPPPYLGMKLFWQCWRIQQEACEASGRYIPLVVENVCGAQRWVGKAAWHYGSYYLWGDVPALMPPVFKGVKVSGLNWSGSDKPGYVARAFNGTAQQRLACDAVKVPSENGRRTDPGRGARFMSRDCGVEAQLWAYRDGQGVKQHGSGPIWWRTGNGAMASKSPQRKAASAAIAKIPFPLACHIARIYKPQDAGLIAAAGSVSVPANV